MAKKRPARRRPVKRRSPRTDPPRRGGRPQTKLTPYMVKTAVKVAANWGTNRAIAAALGISEDTLTRIMKRNAGFAAQVDDARELATHDAAEAVGEIVRTAKHRDRFRAASFVLRARGGWREGNEDAGTPDNPLNVNVRLPGVQELFKAFREGRKKTSKV